MSVSVVIPTKDEEKIFKAIERTREQKPDEIIVVNEESSSEDYKEKLQNISDINYIEVEGGTAKARNRGAEAAESDKILFLDADCYPKDDWLEKMSKALNEIDLAEGEVEYIGRRTPFSRIVENRGEPGKFLTANLGVTSEVFDQVQFDENYPMFREDTDFGLRALKAGFESEFVRASVEHDAGRRTFSSYINDQKRYRTEPYFYSKFKENEKISDYVSKAGPILYPKELIFQIAILAGIIGTLITPFSLTLTVLCMITLSSYYTNMAMKQRDAEYSFKDFILGMFYIPIGMFAKRISIWKGSLEYGVFLI